MVLIRSSVGKMTATVDGVQCDQCLELEDELQAVLEGVIDARAEIEERAVDEIRERAESVLRVQFKRAFEMGYTYAYVGRIVAPTGELPSTARPQALRAVA